MEQLKNSKTVKVIDRFGYLVDTQTYKNTTLAELFPKEDVVLIQWVAEGSNARPTVEDLQKPVTHEGQDYYGCFGWGSAVKRGFTIGMAHDFPREKGPIKLVEDGQRIGRWLMSQGIFGGFKTKELTIGIVKPGIVTKAGPVEDGFGYIKRSLVDKYARKDRISLGKSRDNWTYWQRIPWQQVEAECLPLITNACIDASDPHKMLFSSPHSYEQKKSLYDADPAMIEHPFVAASLNRSSTDYWTRLSTSINLEGEYRTAVPTTVETVCWPGHTGKVAIDRSPIDSNGSIQAIEIEPCPEEEERISKMEVAQISISAKNFSTKGCVGIVDDSLLDYDIVICSEDIKMADDLKAARAADHLVVKNAVVPFIQIWDSKSIVGVNAKWAKNLMGLDHDGDGVRLVNCEDKPLLWQAIQLLPAGETPKLPKSKRDLDVEDLRAEMIYKSMVNLVGFATNVAGATYMVKDREWLAHELGLKSEQALDNRLNFFIKVGTDGFKTDVDQAAVATEVAQMQANLRKMFGRTAPWTSWGQDGWTFQRALPVIIDKTDVDSHLVDGEWKTLSEAEYGTAIWPFMDGTISQIARLVLPIIAPHWKEGVPIRPLTAFRQWAEQPAADELKEADEVQFWYNARVSRVNWTDTKSIQAFKVALAERIEEWLETGIDRKRAANALWHKAHSSRGTDASAASVFMAFPEECLEIVANKPGENVTKVVLTGLSYQLPGFASGELTDLRVADVMMVKGGKKILRRALFGMVEGQVAPNDKSLPVDLIAFIAANCDQPAAGAYSKATIRPIGDSSWSCLLA
jgi:hypothetical protein